MAVIAQCGVKAIFGMREPMPIVGAPEGRQRLRMRNNSAAKLFVKTTDGIRSWVLEDKGDHWFVNPRLEQGRNLRGRTV